jgi:hypothetical protein
VKDRIKMSDCQRTEDGMKVLMGVDEAELKENGKMKKNSGLRRIL